MEISTRPQTILFLICLKTSRWQRNVHHAMLMCIMCCYWLLACMLDTSQKKNGLNTLSQNFFDTPCHVKHTYMYYMSNGSTTEKISLLVQNISENFAYSSVFLVPDVLLYFWSYPDSWNRGQFMSLVNFEIRNSWKCYWENSTYVSFSRGTLILKWECSDCLSG